MGISAVFNTFYTKVTDAFGWAQNHKVTTVATTVVTAGGAEALRRHYNDPVRQITGSIADKEDVTLGKLEAVKGKLTNAAALEVEDLQTTALKHDTSKVEGKLLAVATAATEDQAPVKKLGIHPLKDGESYDASKGLKALSKDGIPTFNETELTALPEGTRKAVCSFMRCVAIGRQYMDGSESKNYKGYVERKEALLKGKLFA